MKNIRNFVIISHIDHGKSTLADRFLELTKTIPKEKMRSQYLDMMDLEREKGITIKMAPVRMEYQGYILNLIDTPGHVDFSYEVSRALSCVEGAILLVDASKGIQAQTIANLELAKNPRTTPLFLEKGWGRGDRQNLVIIPVINKIDLVGAQVEQTKEELSNLLNVAPEEIFEISAKYGTNVKELLEEIIKKIPPPTPPCPGHNLWPGQGGVGDKDEDEEKPLRALIFDSHYDFYKGVIAYLRVFEGKIKKGEKIYLIQSKTEGYIKEVGIFKPELKPVEQLKSGEIGYLATGIKEPEKVRVGETITELKMAKIVEPLPGYQEPKPMVFASLYPQNPDNFDLLKESLHKLKLNNPSLVFEPERKEGLGRGFLCGFLGTLEAEIVSQRLFREYNLDLIITTPSVSYKIIDKNNQEILIKSPADWKDSLFPKEIREPFVKLKVISPLDFLGDVLEILERLEGKQIEIRYFGKNKALLVYEVPFREIITGFYDNLKSVSQGLASMDYQILDYQKADLVKLEILVAGEKKEAFSKIVPRKKAYLEGKKIIEKLKEVLPPQLFSFPLQAYTEGKIIARETIKAKRKDVTSALYGGDYTRKRKLLEKQKRGKKELKEKGRVEIPQNVYFEIFRSH